MKSGLSPIFTPKFCQHVQFGVAFFVLSLCVSVVSSESSIDKDLTITASQSRVLAKFKERVAPKIKDDYMKDDLYLLRWLRVKNFNIQRAEEALMSNIQWRKKNNIDKILTEDFSDFLERYPYWLDGEDKEGKPLIYFHVGIMDLRQVAIAGETDRFMRYVDSAIEKACLKVRTLQEKYQNVTQGILMINIDGYNLVEHGCLQCIPIILRGITSYETHYPGCAEKIILLNTPASFEPLLNAARAILSDYTNNALYIYGKNRREWSSFLDKNFDWKELPSSIGGTKVLPGAEDYALEANE